LVVQCDANNARLQDVIVAVITRTTKLAGIEPTQLLLDIATVEGKATGLLFTSAVKCEHLVTVDHALIQRRVGGLSASLLLKIDNCLKSSLQLP
jgi:mRNA-degrading endonuclease toxin of MazEF toxin-antitoxin module